MRIPDTSPSVHAGCQHGWMSSALELLRFSRAAWICLPRALWCPLLVRMHSHFCYTAVYVRAEDVYLHDVHH